MSSDVLESKADEFLLLILSSPSGAGKTTLSNRLRGEFPSIRFSVSHTTRKPRPTEVDGREYHFVSTDIPRATLTVHGPGEDAEKVKRAWYEISSRDELSVKSERSDGAAHRLIGTKVRRGDKDYPAGVLNVLSSEFAVFAVEQKR